MRLIHFWLVAFVVAAILGFGIAVATVVEPAGSKDTVVVPCPTEDSCALDYRDGAWHITPVIP